MDSTPTNVKNASRESQHAAETIQSGSAPLNGLPDYAEATPENDARTTLRALAATALGEGLTLPLTGGLIDHTHEPIKHQILDSFFDAIRTRKDEVVAMMIEEHLVTADTVSHGGETPLLAAVREGHVRMVQELMDFDADVNAFGVCLGAGEAVARSRYNGSWARDSRPRRTPLQLAAYLGNLNMVKLLMEVYHADDSLIAPDGALALRLAAQQGHREIVAYLPRRRGGGWQRWKAKHEIAVRRVKMLGTCLADTSYFLFWRVPRAICVGTWKNRKKIVAAIKKTILSLPAVAAKLGRRCWIEIKELPSVTKRAVKALVRLIKRVPHVLMNTLRWLWQGVCSTAKGLAHIAASIASFLHTLGSKLIEKLSGVTWSDIWHALLAALKAIFIDFPRSLVSWLKTFGQFSYDALKRLFGDAGKILWWIGHTLGLMAIYLPCQLWEIIAGFGGSISKAAEEILVYLNPKRVSTGIH